MSFGRTFGSKLSRRHCVELLVAVAAVWLGTLPVRAHPGWGIVVDRQGQVYFTDLKGVWKIDTSGRLSRVVAGKHTHALYLDESGNLYGEHLAYDSRNGRWLTSVWKLAPDGSLTEIPPTKSSNWTPFSAVRDARGNAYFAEGDAHTRKISRILRRSSTGEMSVVAGGEWGYADGAGEQARFAGIGSLAIGPDGALYVAESSRLRRVVLGVSPARVTTLASGLLAPIPFYDPAGGGLFSRLMGAAVDARGNVYVANYGNRRVQKITPDGAMSTVAHTGWFWSPSGVVVAGDSVYILEYRVLPPERARVRRLWPDGKIAVLGRSH